MVKKKDTHKSSKPLLRRKRRSEPRKEDHIYFENGLVVETLPGTTFKVKVPIEGKKDQAEISEEERFIQIICHLKTKLIKRKVLIIKGDNVVVEVNPEDMYHDEINKILKGTIIERH